MGTAGSSGACLAASRLVSHAEDNLAAARVPAYATSPTMAVIKVEHNCFDLGYDQYAYLPGPN